MTNWESKALGEILSRSNEVAEVRPDENYKEITVKLWGKGVVLRGVVNGAELSGSRRFLTKKGQLILSRIDARNGAIGIVPESLDGSVVSNDFPLFRLDTIRVLPEYFGWLSKTKSFVELCQRASEGTTNRVRLQEDRFLNLHISLPPLPEQRRIVARIEELAAKINEALALRQRSLEETGALRHAIRRVYFDSCSTQTVELQDVCCDIIDNLHSNPQYSISGIPCIRSPDVGYGTLNLERALRTEEEEYRRRTLRGEPQPDDGCLVREGGGTGKCALVLPSQQFSLGQRVLMIRLNKEKVVPKFFLHQMLSPFIQKEQIAPLSKGSASPHLNIGALKRFRLRLPLLREQHRIATELDSMQLKVDALKKLQAPTAVELNALLPSILHKAFRGEL